MNNKIPFEMTYVALKMFGKQLYSNVGSAISELVANGLDANADRIYVVIDARNRNNATVEILDNGHGMTEQQVQEKYIKIGYNKRKDSSMPSKMMGRKGIGKLAALYLSNKFTIITKTAKTDKYMGWTLDVSTATDDTTPALTKNNSIDFSQIVCKSKWDSQNSGTLVYIEKVDLKGFGDKGLESLARKLSTYFLDNGKIFLNIITKDSDAGKFEAVEKKIAFKNMVCVYSDSFEKFSFLEGSTFKMNYKNKRKEQCEYIGRTEILELGGKNFNISGEREFYGITKSYTLSGWIGVHSTIEDNDAQANDSNYFKSTYYNPNQLRLYVRNKLAVANMLDYLGIARAFANYIEGEISFDILDDDDLPDIATAGRQDFDATDPRFELLVQILKNICNNLVGKRQNLADAIKKEKEETNLRLSSAAKKCFAEKLEKDVSNLNLSEEDKSILINSTVNSIEGEVESKTKYTLFISHASGDRFIADFFYNYLVHLGFNGNLRDIEHCEVFYSTSGLNTNTNQSLSEQIKNFLISASNDVLIIASNNYRNSQYCMFEGGAIWATKAVTDFKIVAIDYSQIPEFLVNGSPEVVFSSKDRSRYNLTRETYNNIIDVLQKLISHLNQNNLVRGVPPVSIPIIPDFPDDVHLLREGKTIEQYMDSEIVEYWNFYVLNKVDDYLKTQKEMQSS